ncbi:MAG: hypothetical protein LBR08_12865 [Bacteroidales bacterium]|jgi:hypothetical protein|nr:hypothetical protein [Bacteroidales bacterium]
MVKVQKNSNRITPFAGISFIDNEFTRSGLGKLIDSEFGNRVSRCGISTAIFFARGLISSFVEAIVRRILHCSKEIIETVAQNSQHFYIRAGRSRILTEQIQQITEWQTLKINIQRISGGFNSVHTIFCGKKLSPCDRP